MKPGNSVPREAVVIVMATFSGERFLSEQIASIVGQTDQNWRLLIRDDGSNDRTLQVAREWAHRDARIDIVQDSLGRLGIQQNFSRLLEVAFEEGAEFVALADQDDVWRPEKLSRQRRRMEEVGWSIPLAAGEFLNSAQRSIGSAAPLLLHSDLELVDEHLRSLAPSMMRRQWLRHEDSRALRTLLVQNFVTGATVFVNRALLAFALPIPKEAVMHDWWLGLCAAATGRILYDPSPLVRYRQHAANAIGAWRKIDFKIMVDRLRVNGLFGDPSEFLASVRQAAELGRRLANRKGDGRESAASCVDNYLAMLEKECSPFARVATLARSGIRRQDALRQFLLMRRIFQWNPDWLKSHHPDSFTVVGATPRV